MSSLISEALGDGSAGPGWHRNEPLNGQSHTPIQPLASPERGAGEEPEQR